MFFLPLILFVMILSPVCLGAAQQNAAVSRTVFVKKVNELKPFSEPITRIVEGVQENSSKNISFVRVFAGDLSSGKRVNIDSQLFLPMVVDESQVTLLNSVITPERAQQLPFEVIRGKNGVKDRFKDKATGATYEIDTKAGQIVTACTVTRDVQYVFVGFSDGSVRKYEFIKAIPAQVKSFSWKNIWTRLCKPTVYVPLLCGLAALLGIGSYWWWKKHCLPLIVH